MTSRECHLPVHCVILSVCVAGLSDTGPRRSILHFFASVGTGVSSYRQTSQKAHLDFVALSLVSDVLASDSHNGAPLTRLPSEVPGSSDPAQVDVASLWGTCFLLPSHQDTLCPVLCPCPLPAFTHHPPPPLCYLSPKTPSAALLLSPQNGDLL